MVLIDASRLGETIKDGKNQRTVLSAEEEKKIIDAFNRKQAEEDFSVVVSYDQIREKNYSFSAGQYFDVKIEYIDLTPDEFDGKMNAYKANLNQLFAESRALEMEIKKQLDNLYYD